MRQRGFAVRTRVASGVSEGRLGSRNCTGSASVAAHSAGSRRTGSSGLPTALRISRPAGLICRITNREYMRLKPLRPLPGRAPSHHFNGFAARLPVSMTGFFTVLADSGQTG